GDAGGSTAWIQSLTGLQNISGAGTINIGSPTSLGSSRIDTTGIQSIGAANIYVTGSGGGGFVNLGAGGTQTVTVSGDIGITGGVSPSGSSTGITNTGAGLQHLTANHIFLTGGSSGSDGVTLTEGISGSTLLDVGGGGLQVTGGAGTNSFATIGTVNDSANVTINVTGGGGATFQGGAGTGAGVAVGVLGSGSTGKTASVGISSTGTVALVGGAGGGVTIGASGNTSNVTTNIGVNAGTLLLTAGAGGGAVIGTSSTSPTTVNHGTLNISVTGNTTLTGSASKPNTAAGIGHFGFGSGSDVTVNFNGGGALNLIGGAQGSAVIGANGNNANATTNLNITAGSISITPGDISNGIARIGHASTANGPGNINLTATSGNISLNDSPGVVLGGAIRTTGNVALHADAPGRAITETVRGVIAANALTTSS
ncbi:MAG: hypothetical protein JF605_17980, partial [Burkholderia sp.]|nr:hypothetical protein [Burkholderia sp.]